MQTLPGVGTCCGGRFVGKASRTNVSLLERKLNLLMLGLDNAGKTCAARSLAGQPLDDAVPTVGFSKLSTRYKGFRVNVFDLGGGKTFRGIWPKYYHEVHGFIFVVDSASSDARLQETLEVFADILSHHHVRGKPILMLCNKADVEEARDEMHIVDVLKVEKLVNRAECPTRVELCVANRNRGLRDGFKWLVKSIIASLPELGTRVELDVEEVRAKEEARRAEVRKRIEEKRRLEGSYDQVDDGLSGLPGFIPISQYISDVEVTKLPKDPLKPSSSAETVQQVVAKAASMSLTFLPQVEGAEKLENVEDARAESSLPQAPPQLSSSIIFEPNGGPDRHHTERTGSSGHSSKRESISRRGSSSTSSDHLDLEPVSRLKKKSVLRKINVVKSQEDTVTSSSTKSVAAASRANLIQESNGFALTQVNVS